MHRVCRVLGWQNKLNTLYDFGLSKQVPDAQLSGLGLTTVERTIALRPAALDGLAFTAFPNDI
jgi:hypothetical protein